MWKGREYIAPISSRWWHAEVWTNGPGFNPIRWSNKFICGMLHSLDGHKRLSLSSLLTVQFCSSLTFLTNADYKTKRQNSPTTRNPSWSKILAFYHRRSARKCGIPQGGVSFPSIFHNLVHNRSGSDIWYFQQVIS